MRKGFMRIVEIVIVTMLAFAVLVQFYQIPKQETEWEKLKLSLQANDIILSLDKKGVDWFNYTEVDKVIINSISGNMFYNLKIDNVIKNEINVGCICSVAETAGLSNALKYFDLNRQETEFRVSQISPDSISFSHEYDVIVVFDYNLTENYTQIRHFLDAGKGIVEFRHFDISEIDSVQSDFFGLEWNSSLNPNSNPVEFVSNESYETYYNIYKYFHHIPIFQDNFSSSSGEWSVQTGTWNLQNGNYVGTGTPAIVTTNAQFQNYSLRAMFSSQTARNIMLIVYWQDISNYGAVGIDMDSDTVTVFENISGNPINRGSAPSPIPLNYNNWYSMKIISEGNNVDIYINNSYVISATLSNIPQRIGLGVENGQASFDNVRVTFSENHIFSNILQNEKVGPNPNAKHSKTVLVQQGTNTPSCIINTNIVNGRGRTAWLASGSGINQETGNMLKSLVSWAAGEERYIVKNEVRNAVVAKVYKVYDEDIYQPVEITLSIGSLYS
ncbi:MAG: hypothetical protein QXN71_00095 [Candidatus Aenigmatarchaeota archaeon]